MSHLGLFLGHLLRFKSSLKGREAECVTEVDLNQMRVII